jgi:hypothetical protein
MLVNFHAEFVGQFVPLASEESYEFVVELLDLLERRSGNCVIQEEADSEAFSNAPGSRQVSAWQVRIRVARSGREEAGNSTLKRTRSGGRAASIPTVCGRRHAGCKSSALLPSTWQPTRRVDFGTRDLPWTA